MASSEQYAGRHTVFEFPAAAQVPTRFPDAAARVLSVLRHLAGRYEEMVVKDPDLTSKIESALRVASYIIPGRLGGGWEVSELIPAATAHLDPYTKEAYCLSNLYALMNDYIIVRKCPAASTVSKCTRNQQILLWSLSVLDCLEVVMEMYSRVMLNEPGKWGVVILVQIVKAVLRSLLVFKLRAGLLTTPAVSSPDRKRAQTFQSQPQSEDGQPVAWKAPRTGKIIRSINADSSIPYSQLHHHISQPSTNHPDTAAGSSLPATLLPKQLIAEALYIARPLVHIFSMFVYQQNSWKPWLISLGMDLASLQLHGGLLKLKSAEKSEILRRRVVLLLYLLRSPFYDHYTKNMLTKFLHFLSSTIPLLYLIVDPVMNYLPVWQQIYSYNWMT